MWFLESKLQKLLIYLSIQIKCSESEPIFITMWYRKCSLFKLVCSSVLKLLYRLSTVGWDTLIRRASLFGGGGTICARWYKPNLYILFPGFCLIYAHVNYGIHCLHAGNNLFGIEIIRVSQYGFIAMATNRY